VNWSSSVCAERQTEMARLASAVRSFWRFASCDGVTSGERTLKTSLIALLARLRRGGLAEVWEAGAGGLLIDVDVGNDGEVSDRDSRARIVRAVQALATRPLLLPSGLGLARSEAISLRRETKSG
jgi:hypothetical protein